MSLITARELAEIGKILTSNGVKGLIPTTERGIQLRGWVSIDKPCRGGYQRQYLVRLLPKDVRVAIAGQQAALAMSIAAGCDGEIAGNNRAVSLGVDQAETQKKREISAEMAMAAFARMPKKLQQEAYARLEILKARDAFVKVAGLPVKRGSEIFCQEFAAGNMALPEWVVAAASRRKALKLSWSSLNRWQQSYDDQGLLGLVNGYKAANKGETTLSQAQQYLVEAMLVEHPEANLTDIIDALELRFDREELPSKASVRRFVVAWKNKHASLYLYMTNYDDWKNRHLAAGGMADENIERLNQLWEFDSTPADVMLTDGRHSVIGVIDLFSRRAKLLVTPTSKATAVAALARTALLDWGVAEGARTDNGKDYTSLYLTRVFEDLSIDQYLCIPFESQEKPFIERFLGTCMHGIVKLLPGYIGHNVAARQRIRARKSFAQRMMKPDEVVDIALSATEFQGILDDWVEAIYHQRTHNRLKMSPAEKARSWTRPVRRITNERALDLLLHEAPGNDGIRVVGKKGIKVGTYHDAPELAGWEGRSVRVLLGADYGTIIVFAADGDEAGQYLCTAVDPDLTGHNRSEITAKRKALQKKIYQEGSKELKKTAREQSVKEIYKNILADKKAKIANISVLPQKSVEYTTPALEEAAMAVAGLDALAHGKQPEALSAEDLAESQRIIDMAEKRAGIRMAQPANEWEAYELLRQELKTGLELSDREHRWLLEYEEFSRTGKRRGLVADGWQPYAERARIAREAQGK